MIRSVLAAGLGFAFAAAMGIATPAAAATASNVGAGAHSESGATSAAPDLWVYPAVSGYGGVRPRPDLPSHLSPDVDYKVIVDVVHGESDPTRVLHSLTRLARLVNLLAYAGIPRDHVHIAAVIEGPAGFAALTDSAFRERFKVDNPNRQLLHELKAAGVELMVCAQALAESHLQDADISPDVTVTLSALTDFVVYGQQGYSYMQL